MTAGGFSSKRLARVRELLERHVDSGFVPGAVAALARHGEDAAGLAPVVRECLGGRLQRCREAKRDAALCDEPKYARAAVALSSSYALDSETLYTKS